jgi:hypothetical protein
MTKLITRLFTPSLFYLYDCIIPAAILAAGITGAVLAGVLRRDLAGVCFILGGCVRVLFLLVALSLSSGRDK